MQMTESSGVELFGAVLGGLALVAIGIPPARRIATSIGMVVAPHSDSIHRGPIPLLGGASIIAAILITLGALSMLPLWMLVGAGGLLILGVIDDAVALRPTRKLAWETVAVTAAVLCWRVPALAPWPWINYFFVVFWLLATVNAFNLIDGLDGLAGGIGITVALAIAAIAVSRHDFVTATQALAVGGALGGFLLFNLHPASIFMGDGGALPLGFLLGAIASGMGGAGGWLTRFTVPALIMIVPLLDMAIVCVSRMATSSPPTRRGLDHSHHKLLALGLSDRIVVRIFWAVSAIAGASAVVMKLLPGAYLVMALPFMLAFFGLIALFMIDLTFDVSEPGAAYRDLHGMARLIVNFGYKRRLAEAGLDLALITAAYFGAFLIRFDFAMSNEKVAQLLPNVPFVLVAAYSAFFSLGVYRGFWRYTGLSEVARLANAAIGAGVALVALSWLLPNIMLSGSIAVLFVILLFNALVASRLSFRVLRKGIVLLARSHRRVLVVGASARAEAAARHVTSDSRRDMRLVGFVDVDAFKAGKLIHGAAVLGTLEDLERVLALTAFNEILIAAEGLTPEKLTGVSMFARDHGITVLNFSIELNAVAIETSVISHDPGEEMPRAELAPAKSSVA
jgi:UDP-GlcNAc:undecaprenyl-phosphate GlcNAc-1-phosphate transferase